MRNTSHVSHTFNRQRNEYFTAQSALRLARAGLRFAPGPHLLVSYIAASFRCLAHLDYSARAVPITRQTYARARIHCLVDACGTAKHSFAAIGRTESDTSPALAAITRRAAEKLRRKLALRYTNEGDG